jgi:uncharacterized membrane protein YdfJ with MMPL/SSD domain
VGCVQQMGFGIAIALLLDATLVRLLLIPAAMRLLGERNWYLPTWLEWLPDLQVEGAPAATTPDPKRAPGAVVPQTPAPVEEATRAALAAREDR